MSDRGDQAGGLTESGIIAEFFAPLTASAPGSLGLRDDVAHIISANGVQYIVTMDTLVAGVHFFAGDDPADIAWKALAVNISDLAAKGAQPCGYLLSLALPGKPQREWFAAFSAGLRAAQNAFGTGLLGGDTTSTSGPLTLTITAFGLPRATRIPQRSHARPGHLVYVSGTIGDAALGLHLRRGGGGIDAVLDPAQAGYLVQRYLRPQPRLALGIAVGTLAAASMDVSDGLVIDLGRICAASSVGARIEAHKVPLSIPAQAAVRAMPEMMNVVLTGGDDYEILATIPPDVEAPFIAAAGAAGVPVTCIGVISGGDGVETVDADGRTMAFEISGFEHFGRG